MEHIILGIGAGRDGTTSLTSVLAETFRTNGHDGAAVHQQDHRFIYNAFAQWKETGDDQHLASLRSTIGAWEPGNAIVGNGYAHVLDLIHDVHGDRVKIIHLQRNKAKWLRSFIENVATFPLSHGNYADSDSPRIRRAAAFHYDEMTRGDWQRLPVEDKAAWYYEKTHTALQAAADMFSAYLRVQTEALSSGDTTAAITRFVDPTWTPPDAGTHVNVSGIDYGRLPAEDRVIVNRFYQEYDYVRGAKHPVEAEQYFAERVIRGFVHRNEYAHSVVSCETLQAYSEALATRLEQVKRLLAESGDDEPVAPGEDA